MVSSCLVVHLYKLNSLYCDHANKRSRSAMTIVCINCM